MITFCFAMTACQTRVTSTYARVTGPLEVLAQGVVDPRRMR
jgi:hypothetical protein